ncbi:MAG: hypothetical protein ABW096_20685 [Candidatus Thiodiazotropha sp.]
MKLSKSNWVVAGCAVPTMPGRADIPDADIQAIVACIKSMKR